METIESWPPATSEEYLSSAIDYATANGLVVRVPGTKTAIHVPFSLFPSPFPKHCYDLAIRLQPIFNKLVHKVAKNKEFIDSVMNQLSDSDEFTLKVYQIYLQTLDNPQKIWMGIHRSDYLLHSGENNELSIKQVELNTIASSFSSLSGKTSQLHRFLNNYNTLNLNQMPKNTSGKDIARCLAKGVELYNSKESIVLMVCQNGENNLYDQREIEHELLESYGIKLLRKSLDQIHNEAKLGPDNRLYIGSKEIAVTYFRAGYSPNDYPSETEWAARLLIEKSYSIKCPNAAYHLAGCKKMQQVLADPKLLERFISPIHAKQLVSCFTGLYPLDESAEGISAYNEALANPTKYVLKPQREGGGNNFYGQDIVQKLTSMSKKERNGYILMDLIKPPPFRNVLVRKNQAEEMQVVSELGIYGIYINQEDITYLNECGGHLLRTKSSGSNEGGVAAGFAVIDSPYLC